MKVSETTGLDNGKKLLKKKTAEGGKEIAGSPGKRRMARQKWTDGGTGKRTSLTAKIESMKGSTDQLCFCTGTVEESRGN